MCIFESARLGSSGGGDKTPVCATCAAPAAKLRRASRRRPHDQQSFHRRRRRAWTSRANGDRQHAHFGRARLMVSAGKVGGLA